ncbi:MAG TPA: hypothetical protein VJV78_34845 [Polyangiales bacterium]|nr:hypothetical protein [Polyangiales bacterium]
MLRPSLCSLGACALCVLVALGAGPARAQTALDRSEFGAAEQPAAEDTDAGDGQLEPWLFVGLLGSAAVLGGITIWSGMNTLALNDEYKDYARQADASPAAARRAYSDAHAAQTRTNVLLASTGILVAAAMVVGVWFTDWGEEAEREHAAKLAPYVGVSERAAWLGFVQEL